MMLQFQPLLHRLSRFLWYSTVTVLVLTAIVISIARTFFPELRTYRETIEQWATDVVGQTVRIGHFDARLVGVTPTFIFSDVRLLNVDGQEIIQFDEARIGLATLSSMRQRIPVPKKVTLVGINLAVTRQKNGNFVFQGFDIASMRSATDSPESSSVIAEWFFSRGSLALRDSTIAWQDLSRSTKTHILNDVNVGIKNSGDRHSIKGYFLPPVQLGAALDFSAVMYGKPDDIGRWSGEVLVSGQRLDIGELEPLAPWLGVQPERGKLDVSLWSEWRTGQLQSVQGQLQADRVAVALEKKGQQLALRTVRSNFGWQRHSDGWRLDMSDIELVEQDRTRWRKMNLSLATHESDLDKGSRFEAKIDHVPLAKLNGFLLDSGLIPKDNLERFRALGLRGALTNVFLQAALVDPQQNSFQFSAAFEDFGVNSVAGIPGADGVSGTIWADEKHGRVIIDAEDVSLDFGTLFRTPLRVDTLAGQLDWFLYDKEWHLRSERLFTANREITAESAVTVTFPEKGGPVYMDLQTHFRDGDASRKSTYLPTGIMDDALVKWLDDSIVSGKITQGDVIFNGRLGDFPFGNREGRFLVAYDAEDMQIRYAPEWPEIEQGAMHVEFTGQGVAIDVHTGEMAGNDVSGATLRIPAYTAPILELQATSTGTTAQLLTFLYNSPIAAGAGDFLRSLDVHGNGSARLEMQLPLSSEIADDHPARFRGHVQLDDSVFRAFRGRVEASDVQGRIQFSEQGVWGENLTAQLWEQPVDLEISSQPAAGHSAVQVTAKSQSGLEDMLRVFELPETQTHSGTVDWQAVFNFGYALAEHAVAPRLLVNAEIRDAKLDLPQPLEFTDQSVIPVSFSVTLPSEEYPVTRFDIGDRVSAAVEWNFDQQPAEWRRAELRFGGVAQLPATEALHFVGSPGKIELSRWLAMVSSLNSVQPQTRPKRRPRPIVLNLGNVEVVPSPKKENSLQLKSDDIPVVHGGIEQFVLNDMQLGRLEVSTSEEPGGYNIDKLSLNSDVFDINLNGKLSYSLGNQTTTLFVKAVSSNVGEMAKQLGYATSIENARGETDITLYWDDMLQNFSWERVSGTAKLKMENGVITDVKPGAGRLFGLLSLSALPQRLELDFRDMKKGFHFDRLEGDVRISKGNAFNDDLRIIGRSGIIQLKGRTGLVARDFDQTVTVVPKIGDTIAVGTGFAFGPQVGIVVLLLERLLGQPLSNAASTEYHVSGSWDDPVIERVRAPEVPSEEDDET